MNDLTPVPLGRYVQLKSDLYDLVQELYCDKTLHGEKVDELCDEIDNVLLQHFKKEGLQQ